MSVNPVDADPFPPAPTAAPTSVDGYARRALMASATGYAMDGFDLLILSFMLPTLIAGLHLSGAQGYWDLLVYRTIAGIGLGGEFGIGMALVAEAWPANKRARASSYVALGWQSGVFCAAFVTPFLLPLIGWRGMFVVGVLPAAVAFALRRVLHEPALFVATARQGQRVSPYRYLFANADVTRTTIGIALMTSIQNFGYYGTIIWLPTYLSTKLGFTLTRSAMWIAVTVAGGAVGMWIFGQLADRIGRKPMFIAFQAGAMAMAFIYPRIADPTALLIAGAFTGVFLSGMVGGYGALISESYPTQARATAQNVLFNVGRGVGGFGPLVIGWLALKYSLPAALSFLVIIWAVDIVVTLFLTKERKGAVLT
jgi:MFS family permease